MPQIILKQKIIDYILKRSRRAKQIRLAVGLNGLKVTLPIRADLKLAESFIKDKADWVLKHLAVYEKRAAAGVKITKGDYLKNKEQARALIQAKVDYFNQVYKFPYKKIAIRNQKTRWGSCSRRGYLNFNFKLIFLPATLADYVVVHELCHLKEMNHGPRFWALVAKTFPNYRQIRQNLKDSGVGLL